MFVSLYEKQNVLYSMFINFPVMQPSASIFMMTHTILYESWHLYRLTVSLVQIDNNQEQLTTCSVKHISSEIVSLLIPNVWIPVR